MHQVSKAVEESPRASAACYLKLQTVTECSLQKCRTVHRPKPHKSQSSPLRRPKRQTDQTEKLDRLLLQFNMNFSWTKTAYAFCLSSKTHCPDSNFMFLIVEKISNWKETPWQIKYYLHETVPNLDWKHRKLFLFATFANGIFTTTAFQSVLYVWCAFNLCFYIYSQQMFFSHISIYLIFVYHNPYFMCFFVMFLTLQKYLTIF